MLLLPIKTPFITYVTRRKKRKGDNVEKGQFQPLKNSFLLSKFPSLFDSVYVCL